MNEMLTLLLVSACGFLLGVIFFGGLWWTIRHSVTSQHPALWFMASFLLRNATVIGGFYWISNGLWQRLTACLVGFILARLLITRLTRPTTLMQSVPAQEANHASES